MSRTSTLFDFRARVAYDPEAKRRFHTHARRQLLALTAALELAPCAFDLRSNAGGTPARGTPAPSRARAREGKRPFWWELSRTSSGVRTPTETAPSSVSAHAGLLARRDA